MRDSVLAMTSRWTDSIKKEFMVDSMTPRWPGDSPICIVHLKKPKDV